MDSDDLKGLLRQAASVPGIQPIQKLPEETIEKIVQVTEDNLEDKWAKIKDKMEGDFAQRFIDEMEMLSGREFIRVYGKMIEYFKPKIVRVENKTIEEKDNVLRIEIYNSTAPAPEVLPTTLDITHEEETQDETT